MLMGGLSESQKECIPQVVFQLIPIRDLVSNQDYQRPLSESHILKAVNEFDVCQINPVKVSRRDGINYVFDGQHTIEIVAAKSGSRDTPVWCMIYDDLLYREEAHIFAEQQKNKKNLMPYEVFNAHVEAGEEKYLLIKELVNSYNLELASDSNDKKNICAVSAIESVYDKYGYQILDRTLNLLIATWEGEQGSFGGTMIKAVAKVIVTYGDEMQEEVFKANVGNYTVRAIVRRAKEICPGIKGYATALVNAYNDKKKRNLLAVEQLFATGKRKTGKIRTESEQDNTDDDHDTDLSEDETDENPSRRDSNRNNEWDDDDSL